MLNGILLIDKPAGMSSAQLLARVKRHSRVRKAGHAGTLDPFATGVLICCVNQATRLARFLLQGEKKYEALLRLGITTDTQDFTGRIIASENVPEMLEEDLKTLFREFEGEQMQQPPPFAALKYQGTPLYKLARQGKPIQKPARPVAIKQLRILNIQLPDILFQVTCSAGTYIRTLCADIGQRIGCGGHLSQLRRTAASGFSIVQAVTFETLKDKGTDLRHRWLIPMAEALGHMPEVTANDQMVEHIQFGRQLSKEMMPLIMKQVHPTQYDGFIKVVDYQRQLKAVIQQAPDGIMYNYCCVFH